MSALDTGEHPIVLPAPSEPWVLAPTDGGPNVVVDRPVGLLGRGRGVAYRVVDRSVSRVHAELEYDGAGLVVSDLGSASGTAVDGGRIHAPTRLLPGVTLQVGRVELLVTAQGEVPDEPPPPARPTPPPVDSPLTPRQTEVLHGMAAGLTNAEIAARLGLAPRTVKAYAAEIFDRLGRRSRAGAVAVAFRLGLLRDA